MELYSKKTNQTNYDSFIAFVKKGNKLVKFDQEVSAYTNADGVDDEAIYDFLHEVIYELPLQHEIGGIEADAKNLIMHAIAELATCKHGYDDADVVGIINDLAVLTGEHCKASLQDICKECKEALGEEPFGDLKVRAASYELSQALKTLDGQEVFGEFFYAA